MIPSLKYRRAFNIGGHFFSVANRSERPVVCASGLIPMRVVRVEGVSLVADVREITVNFTHKRLGANGRSEVEVQGDEIDRRHVRRPHPVQFTHTV